MQYRIGFFIHMYILYIGTNWIHHKTSRIPLFLYLFNKLSNLFSFEMLNKHNFKCYVSILKLYIYIFISKNHVTF